MTLDLDSRNLMHDQLREEAMIEPDLPETGR